VKIPRRPTPNRRRGRQRHKPLAVVVHTTDGAFESAAAWFSNPESGVAAHYLVGLDGRILRFVAERDTALHAGVLVDPDPALVEALGDDPNLTTIGIEFADDGHPSDVPRTAAQYAAGAELLRQVAERWAIPLDRGHVIPHRALRADKTCPGNLDLDRLIAEASTEGIAEGSGARGPFLVALLPVRNEAGRLPAWLDRARTFADAVVALDDGSTDGTHAVLEADPLVRILLTNQERDTYEGWDDATNRQRLLDAAADLRPTWIVQIDADEVIEPEDARGLRAFLERDALAGCAYGLQHYRAWGDHIDPKVTWVYRIFAWRPGLRLPEERRLHFNPVPESIPRGAWLRTTFRIRHEGAADEDAVASRIRKYAEADPEAEFEANTSGMETAPVGEPLTAWDVRATEDPLAPPALQAAADPSRPLLVALLPVRNGEEDLPGWFDSVRGLADAVIALDDGSTDSTRIFLEGERPFVAAILTNPVRAIWKGWDEPRDRQRLLVAAEDLNPRFVLFLDTDERIDPADGAALRAFLDADALPSSAYGFRVHRMVRDDPAGYDRNDLWVYRLFGWTPGLTLSDQPLHFVPVPLQIPRDRYRRTTIGIQHLASLTDERRRARLEKYREVDPQERYQRGYGHLVDPPGEILDWEPRAPGSSVIDTMEFEDEAAAMNPDAPVLSAIIIARDDANRIERVVRSVVTQETEEPFETIVAVSGSPRTAAVVREHFGDAVTLIELDRPVLPGAARNAGLQVARGDYVSFPGSHVELPPGSLQARIEAHAGGYPMVTGSILNGTRTAAGWASYFLDHAAALPGRPSGVLLQPPAHCSYDRGFLVAVGGFPTDLRAGEDTLVNTRLFAQGLVPYRAQGVVLTHTSPSRAVPAMLHHHFVRGQAFGRLLFDPTMQPPNLRRRTGRIITTYVPQRLKKIDDAVVRWADTEEQARYRRVRRLVMAGLLAAWAGTLFESGRWLVRRAGGRLRTSDGRSGLTER